MLLMETRLPVNRVNFNVQNVVVLHLIVVVVEEIEFQLQVVHVAVEK
jgi:hypothetical protein